MKLPKKRIFSLMGGALLLTVAAGVVFFFRDRSPSDDYALEKADYPRMASHPKGGTSSRKWDAPEEEVEFVLDRPFLFVITSNDGLPLFVGTVYRPS